MDKKFCNQANAYLGTYSSSSAVQADLGALHVYEQLKQAIESMQDALSEQEGLLVLWQGRAGDALKVSHIGYFGQTFLVFGGRDAQAVEWSALLPAHSAQVILKILSLGMGETFHPIGFIGHALKPQA